MVDELNQSGVMPPQWLCESPLTDVNAQEPLGVLPSGPR